MQIETTRWQGFEHVIVDVQGALQQQLIAQRVGHAIPMSRGTIHSSPLLSNYRFRARNRRGMPDPVLHPATGR